MPLWAELGQAWIYQKQGPPGKKFDPAFCFCCFPPHEGPFTRFKGQLVLLVFFLNPRQAWMSIINDDAKTPPSRLPSATVNSAFEWLLLQKNGAKRAGGGTR